jgi:hypothetical protein
MKKPGDGAPHAHPMTTTPDTPTSPDGDGSPDGGHPQPELGNGPADGRRPAPESGTGSPDGGHPAPDSAASSATVSGLPPGWASVAMSPSPGVPRLPSLRATAALAAGMLALGVAVGAAIGPAPSASLAGERVPLLLPSIAALAVAGSGGHASTTTAPPPVTPQPTPSATSTSPAAGAGDGGAGAKEVAKSKTPSSAGASPTSTPSTSKTPTTATTPPGSPKQTVLPPVTSVWLITLSGGTFAQALAQPAAAPYIDSQLVPAGALLSGWSSLQGSAFASEAGLLGGESPQTLNAIVQPPCPEGAAGTQCKPATAGALTAADEFLKQTVPSITSSVAYREHGLIVITFGAIGNATASSLPAGSSTATLGSEPAAGVLLVSPFAHAGSRPTTAYDPTSPKQSLSGLLR